MRSTDGASHDSPRPLRGRVRGPRRSSLTLAIPLLAYAALVLCCAGGGPDSEQGSETHFLRSCDAGCDDGFVCRCGVCTQVCTTADACSPLAPEARCVPLAPRVGERRCASASEPAYCDVPCLSDVDCSAVELAVCDRGFCRERADVASPPDGLMCSPSDIAAGELVILGDAVLELSGFRTALEDTVAASGALSAADDYRDYASSQTSFLAEGPLSISTQYASARAQGTTRVVVMTGGATDMLQNPCPDDLSASCPEIRAAVRGAEQLFERMADDGVQHVVYAYYPNPRNNAAFQAGLDALRPLVANACGRSPVSCHFLDLRPVFAAHDDYLGADGIVFSEAGARATAAAVWSLMQERCVPR